MAVVRFRRWIAGVSSLAVAELAMSSAVVSMKVVSTLVVLVTVTVVVSVYLLGIRERYARPMKPTETALTVLNLHHFSHVVEPTLDMYKPTSFNHFGCLHVAV